MGKSKKRNNPTSTASKLSNKTEPMTVKTASNSDSSKITNSNKTHNTSQNIDHNTSHDGFIVRKIIFSTVPEENVFILRDGRKLRNLNDLLTAFEDMTDEVYEHHVNLTKNDFSNWIKEIIREESIAEEMRTAVNRLEAQSKVMKNILRRLIQ